MIGALASVAGLFLGLGLAKGLSAIFAALGADHLQSGIVVAPRTIIVSLLAGILITLAASLVPAMRLHRVPPIAAVRRGGNLAAVPLLRFAPLGLILIAGIALSRLRHGGRPRDPERLISVGVGCLILFIGVADSPLVVKPLARVLGWPAERVAGGRRQARSGELDAEPASHGLDGRCPHDRTGAHHVRGRPRPGLAVVHRRCHHPAGQRRLCRRLGRQLHAVPAGLGRGGGCRSGRRGRRRSRRRGREHGARRTSLAPIRQDRAGLRLRWIEGSDASLAALADGNLVEKSLAEDKQLELDSLVIVETPSRTHHSTYG